MKKYLIAIIIQLFVSVYAQQKVGLVLSGGGANGLAHIGVLKALEENNIPIDYIAGASMGAFIGGMYASGYSVKEIEDFVLSKEYLQASTGVIDEKYQYYFKKENDNASWITIKLSKDTVLQTSLPTNLISSIGIDYEMMRLFSDRSAAANYNFDSLMIPFRCVASDIENKKEVIFSKGNLSQAIRASMSYPFYLKPIRVNGVLLFDGGLYNNFPADVMFNEFHPDIIIGCNVSGNFDPPEEDNLFSQVANMLVSKTDYSLAKYNGVLIEPELNSSTFEFKDIEKKISAGYKETIKHIYEIKSKVIARKLSSELAIDRDVFISKTKPVVINNIVVNGVNKRQEKYVHNMLKINKKNKTVEINDLKFGLYRLHEDDKIKDVYPLTYFDKESGMYMLNLDIRKEKDIFIDFGGNFSSRSINQAYIGAQYNYLGRTAFTLKANSYFGKLYGSAQLKARWDFPYAIPFNIETQLTFNRWDYFKSQSTFFEDSKPSYLIQNEKYGLFSVGLPIKNNSRIKFGASLGQLKDNYYQTASFKQSDTADATFFDYNSLEAKFENGTLNKKQYANQGTYFSVSARLVEGEEFHVPGSTTPNSIQYARLHQWGQIKLVYDTYYKRKGLLRLGFYGEAVYSNQPLFNNYSASILRAPAFQPNPESKTLFLESFRAFKYAAVGHKFIFNIQKNLDLRLAGYLFQPYREIIRNDDLSVSLGKEFARRYTILTSALVYHTPIGPVSFSTNYYYNNPEIGLDKKAPITFLFHFGYVIFNKRALN